MSVQVNEKAGKVKGIALLCIAAAAAVVAGCVTPGEVTRSSGTSATIRYVEPADVRPLQLKGEVFLIHVGDDIEYDAHHIPGASQRKVSDLAALASLMDTAPIILYEPGFGILHGDEVQPALAQLAGRASVLRGGLAAWEQMGFPVEGRGVEPDSRACRPVSVAALRRALRDRDDFTVLDVRARQDFEMAHIPRAASATPEELGKLLKTLSKDYWVILYDEHGRDSPIAGEQFIGAGFRYCGYLAGGHAAWAGGGATTGAAARQKK